MNFKFKIQQYQTDAVDSVVNCFIGQPYQDNVTYRRDIGTLKKAQTHFQTSFDNGIDEDKDTLKFINEYDESGFRNDKLRITREELLSNIKAVQRNNNLVVSNELKKDLGECSLDIEMETGTGKTYVYIKTMYELNKRYGWTKFVVVVPTIAIREGVKKSFEITQDHFMEYYHKKIRFFVYNSNNLSQLDSFSSNSGINVMIINIQAFNKLVKEDSTSKESLIFNSERDEFGGRRPRDVIRANKPIIIRDEPQKMSGKATQTALKYLKPLFVLNYSATHKERHNLVYELDAVDAYNQKLVKKIEVKGFQVKNLRGTGHYLYLDEIIISPKEGPRARIEYEVYTAAKEIKRKTEIFEERDNLYQKSRGMNQYEGYVISKIDPIFGEVSFLNGVTIKKGEILGDVAEKDMRRIQIRETIKSHFEKEQSLFDKGIKTLSLFFIDEVARYRQYDEDGNELLGEYGKIFEDEYYDVMNEYIKLFETPYQRYLKGISVKDTHKGYFSIDKKGHAIDSHVKRGDEGISDDISAYDLILKNKERLLSFDEPTRFIFSHSALREGWDNPNVFQICTLKHSESTTSKRQEVGRGLRLCVDKDGYRMDEDNMGADRVHEINKLTVIASESYTDFVKELQSQISENLYDRPRHASREYFADKTITFNGAKVKITQQQATQIYSYLLKNEYVTDDGEDNITPKYRSDLASGNLAPLPEPLEPYKVEIQKLIQSVYDESVLKNMIDDGNKTKITNELNENFYKKEFQTLWGYINHKYAYTVEFDSKELIRNSKEAINNELYVTKLQYTSSVSEQKDKLTADAIRSGDSFKDVKSSTTVLKNYETSQIKYDLIGEIAESTTLTRKTVADILKGINEKKFEMFRNNPEEFIAKVTKIIKEQKATMIVEHISYDRLEGKYESSIFTAEKHATMDKAFEVKKHIQPYVFTDGTAEKSVERRFAESLEGADEVVVYAKLPRGFYIPTPVGDYSPDWAIAFKEGTVEHIYFVAETKGTLDSLQLRPIEQAKIKCADKLFNEISTDNVVYSAVDSYQSLRDIMPTIDKKCIVK